MMAAHSATHCSRRPLVVVPLILTVLLARRCSRRTRGGMNETAGSGARRFHVSLGTKPQGGGPAALVELEDDPLPLAEHAEDRAVERVLRQVELGEIRV